MKNLRRVSLVLIISVIFAFASLLFVGCDNNKDICRLYVIAGQGGYVLVGETQDKVTPGEKGSKLFNFDQNQIVTLKAVADNGYRFVKWECTGDKEDILQDDLAEMELNIILDDGTIVVKAKFELIV